MPIRIVSSGIEAQSSDEYRAAEKLKMLFESEPAVVNAEPNMVLIPSVQCHGQPTKDIDIVILGSFKKLTLKLNCRLQSSEPLSYHAVNVVNICTVVEVKSHGPEAVQFKGDRVEVKMGEDWHNATKQNEDQKYSLKNYLADYGLKSPWITNVIILDSVSKQSFRIRQNCFFKDSTVSDFFEILFSQKYPYDYKGSIYFSAISRNALDNNLDTIIRLLSVPVAASRLDRQKLEKISKKVLKDQQYFASQLGLQLLIIKGLGGSGKTFRILNLAYELYRSLSKRALILTYNLALVADIKRLFAILRISDGLENAIQIRSIYSFFSELLRSSELFSEDRFKGDDYYNVHFPALKSEFLEYLKSNTVSKEDIKLMILKNAQSLNWDFVLIDEAQDWPTDERDILYHIYGYGRIVVADGINQMVRGYNSCDWTKSNTIPKQIVSLRKSLRQKRNICRFVNLFAERLGVNDWDLEENDEADGGNVIVICGEFRKDINERLANDNAKAGNSNIDMLYCIPPSFVKNEISLIAQMLNDWGYKTWDGASMDVRKQYPTDLNQLRIVQYDSCRGLEAWTAVHLAFEDLWDYKVRTFKKPDSQEASLFDDIEPEKLFAAKWLLIPLTRAIDTLVINLRDRDHEISKMIIDTCVKHKDYCELIGL